MAEVRFDDIDGLNAEADVVSEWGPELEVTQEMINEFAELTGDHQWIHVDVERAKKESPFGGPVAHGFLTLSLLPKLAFEGQGVTVTDFKNAVNYGAEKLRFLSPVPAGAKVHARSKLLRAEAKPKGVLITTEQELGVVGTERPAILYAMQVLYMG